MNETPQKGDVWQTIGKRGDKRRVTGIGDDWRGTIVRWEGIDRNDNGDRVRAVLFIAASDAIRAALFVRDTARRARLWARSKRWT